MAQSFEHGCLGFRPILAFTFCAIAVYWHTASGANRGLSEGMQVGDMAQPSVAAEESDPLLESGSPPEKQGSDRAPNIPAAFLWEGDRIENAIAIRSLPFQASGTTQGFTDDYDGDCALDRTAPDVVYKFTPSTDVFVNIGLCGSQYDTRLYVYRDSFAVGSTYVCNDDACSYRSLLRSVKLPAGSTYYIVVDGWRDEYGEYQLEVTEVPSPETISCPPGAIVETEACLETPTKDSNEGCNASPPSFRSIACGDTICGTAWTSDSLWDVDWYSFTLVQPMTVTWRAVANFPVGVGLQAAGCTGPYRSKAGVAFDTTTIKENLPVGTYTVYILPSVREPHRCEVQPWVYTAWMSCDALTLPSNDSCQNAQAISEVVDLAYSTRYACDEQYRVLPGDIWFRYTPSCTGTALVSLCGSGYDSRLLVYDGATCPPSTVLFSLDNQCDDDPEFHFEVTAGREYLLKVYGDVSPRPGSGEGVLSVTCHPPASKAYCQNAVPVSLPASISGTVLGAQQECNLVDKPYVLEAFHIDTSMDVRLSLRGIHGRFGTIAGSLISGCPCSTYTRAENAWALNFASGDSTLFWPALPPGTYYYPIVFDRNSPADYTLEITGDSTEPYCHPGYRGCDNYIKRVALGSIDQTSICSRYGSYTASTTQMWRRLKHRIDVDINYGQFPTGVEVYFDWNHDIDFADPNERFGLTRDVTNGSYHGVIEPPAGSYRGPTRMRVVLSEQLMPQACADWSYGETEDYTVFVDELVWGDCNSDGAVTTEDLSYLVNYYFHYGAAPVPLDVADVNHDGIVNIADIEYLVQYLYDASTVPSPQNP